MPRAEAAALAEKVAAAPRKYKASALGSCLRLTDTERTALHITTIRAVDVSAVEMATRRKQRDRERKRVARLRRRVTMAEPVSRSRPWQACGISRATWYRRRKVQSVRQNESAAIESTLLRTRFVSRSLHSDSKDTRAPERYLVPALSGIGMAIFRHWLF
jgi:hypothetical protein